MRPELNRDDVLVTKNEALLGLDSEVIERIQRRLPHLAIPVTAVDSRGQVGCIQAASGRDIELGVA